jgi:hypothetical protein
MFKFITKKIAFVSLLFLTLIAALVFPHDVVASAARVIGPVIGLVFLFVMAAYTLDMFFKEPS